MSLMSGKSVWYRCLCSRILLSKKASESSLWTGATTSSVMSFRSMRMSHAGSSSGTREPTKKGKNLSRLQFSCAFPPTVFLREKVCDTTWGLFVLSAHLYGNFNMAVFSSANVKYFFEISTVRQRASSTGIIPSNTSWARSGG